MSLLLTMLTDPNSLSTDSSLFVYELCYFYLKLLNLSIDLFSIDTHAQRA